MAAAANSYIIAERIFTCRTGDVGIEAYMIGTSLRIYMEWGFAENIIAVTRVPIEVYGGIGISCRKEYRIAMTV
jgi:hypothetical protein